MYCVELPSSLLSLGLGLKMWHCIAPCNSTMLLLHLDDRVRLLAQQDNAT